MSDDDCTCGPPFARVDDLVPDGAVPVRAIRILDSLNSDGKITTTYHIEGEEDERQVLAMLDTAHYLVAAPIIVSALGRDDL